MTVQFFVQPDTADEDGLKLLFDNLSLIQQNRDLILNTPQYYNIRIAGCGVFALYVPTFSLFIGDLLRLWEETEWKQGDAYFYCITGSPLSGSNSSSYWSKTEGFNHKTATTFGKQVRSALMLINHNTCQIPAGNSVPIRVSKRSAADLSIEELIENLKQRQNVENFSEA